MLLPKIPLPKKFSEKIARFSTQKIDPATGVTKSVEPCERILRALFISQWPYKFSSFLIRRNVFNRFRLFSRDFRLFPFFFPGPVLFAIAPPEICQVE